MKNLNEYEEKQNKIFNKINLDRSSGIEKLQSIKKKFDLKIQRSMSSEHETLFSSIAINNNYKIHKILEIGTFDGYNALLLSKIFPEAEIETISISQMHLLVVSNYKQHILLLSQIN